MLVIGLTGGIASGKSTVTKLFLNKGVTVIDADQMVRQMQQPNTKLLKQLAEVFGNHLILEDGNLNRQALGALIFHDSEAKKTLDDIMKPLIFEKLLEEIELAKLNQESMLVLDLPLLYEFELQSLVDYTVVVYVSRETQVSRLMNRDQINESYALAKINSQMLLDQKRELANFVLVNEGSMDELRAQFEEVYETLTKLS